MKEIDDVWRGWFVGFTDGEGHFGIRKDNRNHPHTDYSCRFTISLRDDDRSILEEIHETLGIGTIYDHPANTNDGYNRQPQAEFNVFAIAECVELVKVFETYPLRAKKQRDFDIWAKMVAELQRPVDERDPLMLDYYFEKIKEIRQYEKQASIEMPKIKEIQLTIKYEDEA